VIRGSSEITTAMCFDIDNWSQWSSTAVKP